MGVCACELRYYPGRVIGAEHGIAGHEHIGSGRGKRGGVGGAYAAVYLDKSV